MFMLCVHAKMADHPREIFVCGYYSRIMESNRSIEFTARYLQCAVYCQYRNVIGYIHASSCFFYCQVIFHIHLHSNVI